VIQFLNARQRADRQVDSPLCGPFSGQRSRGGDIVQIDGRQFRGNQSAVDADGGRPERRSPVPTTLGITTDANLPSMGRPVCVKPIRCTTAPNRMLVSWAPCLVLNTTRDAGHHPAFAHPATPAAPNCAGWPPPPIHHLDLRRPARATLSPHPRRRSGHRHRRTGHHGQARALRWPTFIPDFVACPRQRRRQFGPTTATADWVLLVIRSVYDFDGIDMVGGRKPTIRFPIIAALADPKQGPPADPAPGALRENRESSRDSPIRRCADPTPSAFGPRGLRDA